jgi:hypothetical protein
MVESWGWFIELVLLGVGVRFPLVQNFPMVFANLHADLDTEVDNLQVRRSGPLKFLAGEFQRVGLSH